MSPNPRIPSPEGLNAEFYEQAQGGVLHLQECSDCGVVRHPPRYRCGKCSSGRYQWSPSGGRGHLFSWTVTHLAFDRGWADDIPYATGVLELDEGVRIVGSIDGLPAEELRLGLPMATKLTSHGAEFSFLSFHADRRD
jgi:uncharacterized OB-fold protein